MTAGSDAGWIRTLAELDGELRRRAVNVLATRGSQLNLLEVKGLAFNLLVEAGHDDRYTQSNPLRAAMGAVVEAGDAVALADFVDSVATAVYEAIGSGFRL